MHKYLKEWGKLDGTRLFSGVLSAGPEAVDTNWNREVFTLWEQENSFHCDCDSSGTGTPEKPSGVSHFRDIPDIPV